jgi:hypothetical protein
MGINFPDQPPLWTDILVYKDIRNFIAHNDGRLGDSDKAKKVKAFINARSSISLDHRKRIRVSGDFYLEVINTLESFFDELLKALPQRSDCVKNKLVLRAFLVSCVLGKMGFGADLLKSCEVAN